MQPEQPDAQLMIQLASGDDAVLETIMHRYKAPILNFALRMLGSHPDAEDVAQDVFVRVYQHRHDYNPDQKFSTWLFGIARNAAIDRLRWRTRHPTEGLDDTAIPPTSPEPSPSDATAASELGAEIARAIAALPEDQRTVIVLSEYHALSHAEIAAIVHTSEKAVESRLYRAKQTLRQQLRHLLD
jgi:RNA polymerase sigma-70 factor (ECF subfamily)